MGVIEIRLCDSDIEKYATEDTPEWVPFDRSNLDDVPFDVQHPWEEEMRIGVLKLLSREFDEATALGIKGVVWLAWKMAGLDTPRFKDFNIITNSVRWRDPAGDDADPPAPGSSEPSPETSTTTPSEESSPS